MELSSKTQQHSGSRWLEGLLLLIVLIFVILFSNSVQAQNITIPEQEVSLWSGSIDNLE